jgi:menaquinone-dependent protoporphyrinogen IX oxidase
MNIVCLYGSKSGHSRKIAQEIGTATDIPVFDFRTAPIGCLDNAHTVIIVGGIYAAKCLPEFVQYIQDNLQTDTVKQVFIISSSMAPEATLPEIRTALAAKKIPVNGEYHCKGSFLFFGRGHPDSSEIAGAVNFAKKIHAN